jgi:L-threonylcarbamoyladenylate synthase
MMRTLILKINDPVRDIEAIKKAAECINSGGLVVFPTETVYGIACKVEQKSLARLDEIKKREADKRYTLHIGDKSKLQDFVPTLSLPAKKLVKNAWPGPLTIVFELEKQDIAKLEEKLGTETVKLLYKDNTIGIRCPDNPVASAFLSLCSFPVVAPSANTAGNKPAVNAKQAIEQLDGLVDMILDAGPCKYKKNSTVVKISSPALSCLPPRLASRDAEAGEAGEGAGQILREGVYSAQQIRKMLTVNILFVCTGNTCRSPMAGGFAKKLLAEKLKCDIDPAPSCSIPQPRTFRQFDFEYSKERGQKEFRRCGVDRLEQIGYKITSAGVIALDGIDASAEAIRFCASRGVRLTGHKSRRLTAEMLKEADYIFAMSAGHRDDIIRLFPASAEKCMLLNDAGDINDPMGGDFEAYKICGLIIEKTVNKRISELLK